MKPGYLNRSTTLFALLVAGSLAAPSHYGSNVEGTDSREPGSEVDRKETAQYALSWFTIDGGGVSVIGEPQSYRLGGTLGQPDAALVAQDSYGLRAGFWVEPSSELFRDGFESGDLSAWSQVVNGT